MRFGRLLAEAVTRYVAELEKARRQGQAAGGRSGDVPGRRRDGSVMEAGRLELVPPAAPGFSPVARKR